MYLEVAAPMSRTGELAIAATALALFLAAAPAVIAQGLDSEGAIETIVGSDIATGESTAEANRERIEAAIENSLENATQVRMRFSLDKVEIVFVPDMEENAELEAKLAEHRNEITELRQAIEGSAMFYHAIDSRRVMLRNVIGIEFGEDGDVTIFAAGADPAGPHSD